MYKGLVIIISSEKVYQLFHYFLLIHPKLLFYNAYITMFCSINPLQNRHNTNLRCQAGDKNGASYE